MQKDLSRRKMWIHNPLLVTIQNLSKTFLFSCIKIYEIEIKVCECVCVVIANVVVISNEGMLSG